MRKTINLFIKKFLSLISNLQKFCFGLCLSFRLGYAYFDPKHRDFDFYKSNVSKNFFLRGLCIDKDGFDKILKDSLSYLNPNSFYCKITSMKEFLNKSKIYKILSLLGVICLIIGISNYNFGLSESINHICTLYGMLYMGFKFLFLIFHLFFLFSRLNYLYNDNVKILGLSI